jgi:glycosyltransferase involved in cell wall biosynthesis
MINEKLRLKLNKRNNMYPFVSICTPTFNRRPFIPSIIKCFLNQDYPKDRMEWIIIDDGTDKIEDLVSHIPQVKYFKYDEKMFLGKKRNIMHDKSNGDIIVYMDDDDYYPTNRVSHAVETLQKNPNALCAGSSEMFIYFKHIQKMYKFGPYGPNHATAATFAFRRELLLQTRYEEGAALAEERAFLKGYTIPFVQLDSMKTILVLSHVHNSFDKKTLLEQPNKFVTLSTKTVSDFIKEPEIFHFFMEFIDKLLENYEPGKPENKPDVLKQIEELTLKRIEMMEQQKREIEQNIMRSSPMDVANAYGQKLNEQNEVIQKILLENGELKTKVEYLEAKIKEIVKNAIRDKMNK